MNEFHLPRNRISESAKHSVLKQFNWDNVTQLFYDPVLCTRTCAYEDQQKQKIIIEAYEVVGNETYDLILDTHNSDDLRTLIRYEDELANLQWYERVFPSE